jgi:hypothetical protein
MLEKSDYAIDKGDFYAESLSIHCGYPAAWPPIFHKAVPEGLFKRYDRHRPVVRLYRVRVC